jgi:endogenous inhibitor of DNA gyrase (YacG/DUF329 family)
MRCPTCRKQFDHLDPAQAEYIPFCSRRCKLLDLGKWLDESYAIPGEPAAVPDLAPEDGDEGDH